LEANVTKLNDELDADKTLTNQKIGNLKNENDKLKQALTYAEDNFEEVYIPVYPTPIPTYVPTKFQKNTVMPDIFRLPGDKLM
jgi:hypothetical protein